MKKIIHPANAPAPVGPYSPAILSDSTLYISGQIAIRPSDQHLVCSDIQAETEQVLLNIEAILLAANMDFQHLVKCSIFVIDMNDYDLINTVYARFFRGILPPARELVQVAALPKGVNIEISAIAYKG